jgi:hypothetical protein
MMMKQFNKVKRKKKKKRRRRKIQNIKPLMLKKDQYEKRIILFQKSMLNN